MTCIHCEREANQIAYCGWSSSPSSNAVRMCGSHYAEWVFGQSHIQTEPYKIGTDYWLCPVTITVGPLDNDELRLQPHLQGGEPSLVSVVSAMEVLQACREIRVSLDNEWGFEFGDLVGFMFVDTAAGSDKLRDYGVLPCWVSSNG